MPNIEMGTYKKRPASTFLSEDPLEFAWTLKREAKHEMNAYAKRRKNNPSMDLKGENKIQSEKSYEIQWSGELIIKSQKVFF